MQDVSHIAGSGENEVRSRAWQWRRERETFNLERHDNGESLGSVSSTSLTTRTAAEAATSAEADQSAAPVYKPSAPSMSLKNSCKQQLKDGLWREGIFDEPLGGQLDKDSDERAM